MEVQQTSILSNLFLFYISSKDKPLENKDLMLCYIVLQNKHLNQAGCKIQESILNHQINSGH